MSPKEPTPGWFDSLETNTRDINPDGTNTSYFLTVREYHQRVIEAHRERERVRNRQQIQILRRQNLINQLNQDIEAFGPDRPPRQAGESLTQYLERLRAGI